MRTETPAIHIVRIFRHGWLKSSGRRGAVLPVYYVDMEIGLINLEDYIKSIFSRNPLAYPPEDHPSLKIWRIMQEIATGIDFIHRRGIIHRDIKPANGKFQNPVN